MRKSIPLIVLAALLAAPTAVAQSQGQDQSKSTAQGYKPSADTPAKQKEKRGLQQNAWYAGQQVGSACAAEPLKLANDRKCLEAVQVGGLKHWQA